MAKLPAKPNDYGTWIWDGSLGWVAPPPKGYTKNKEGYVVAIPPEGYYKNRDGYTVPIPTPSTRLLQQLRQQSRTEKGRQLRGQER